MDKLKTIVWDVDDVLNDLMRSWLLLWCQKHPGCVIGYDDLKENPPHEVLAITLESYLQSLDAFRLSPAYQQMVPREDVRDWFLQHGRSFRHIALTAVPLRAAPLSAQWVFRHFGLWIRTFHFVPSKREDETIPDYDRDKTAVLQRLGMVDFFVDDHAEHVVAAQKAGVNSLFFPRPWNQREMSVAETLGRLRA